MLMFSFVFYLCMLYQTISKIFHVLIFICFTSVLLALLSIDRLDSATHQVAH